MKKAFAAYETRVMPRLWELYLSEFCFDADSRQSGVRLRDFLRREAGISHGLLTELKRTGGIFVNGAPVTVRYLLCAGDRVALRLDETAADALIAAPGGVEILFEDAYVMAVNKPPNMPTHPSRGHFADTLANRVAWLMAERGASFVFRAVNRLDRDTSGVVLIAKNRFAADRFSPARLAGGYEKTYIAICQNHMPRGSQTVQSYIRRESPDSIRRVSCPGGAASEFACTRYEAGADVGGCSVVRCFPVTGRTHQIRVHLSSLGYPIVGDTLYGGGDAMQRQALHALRLRFIHPFSGSMVQISAPLPRDMADFIKKERERDTRE